MYSLRLIKNKIDFFLNEKLGFSRVGYVEKPEGKSALFSDKIEQQADKLIQKYNLEFFKEQSSITNYLENLWLLDILDKFLNVGYKKELNILEIGCKNWSCAKSQFYFFKKQCESLNLTGIELDANKLYYNLFSRKEAAKFYCKKIENAQYIAGDFLEHQGEYDYIIWVLPFLFEDTLTAWGLPKKYFTPQKMLEHAMQNLSPQGKILIVNQGEQEYQEQKRLYNLCKIDFQDIGKIHSPYFDYKTERYLTIANN